VIIDATFTLEPAFQNDSGSGAVDVSMLHPPAALATGALAAKFGRGLERGGVFVGAVYRQLRARGQGLGELFGARAQPGGGAVGMLRAAHHQQLRLVLVQQPIYGSPVHAAVGDQDGALGCGGVADGVARGDSNTT
jgi:hypothetical protein